MVERITRKTTRYGESGYERIAGDAYFTIEPWPVDVLCRTVALRGQIWEPACGAGHMVRRLEAHCYAVWASDLLDHGCGVTGRDFLAETLLPAGVETIVTNPPNGLTDAFALHALDLLRPVGGMLALFVPTDWDSSGRSRFRRLLPPHAPLALKLVCRQRPLFFAERRGAPRTPYCWMLWDWRHAGPATVRYVE